MQAPCKDCSERHYMCHSTCEKYLEFRKFQDALMEHRRKEQQLLSDLWGASRHNRKHRSRPYFDKRGER